MSASVSESCHSQRHTFKGRGRGRARLLQEQVKVAVTDLMTS